MMMMITKARVQTHSHNTEYFSIATMVLRMRLIVTLYLQFRVRQRIKVRFDTRDIAGLRKCVKRGVYASR